MAEQVAGQPVTAQLRQRQARQASSGRRAQVRGDNQGQKKKGESWRFPCASVLGLGG